MFVVAGVTGHVGSVVAAHLLAAGEQVRVLVRDRTKGERWRRQGAEVAVADLSDRDALTDALRGAHGCFVLLPFNLAAADIHADQRRMADAIAGAVQDSGVRHAVMLSSIGADLATGTGPIQYLHYLENLLRGTGAVVTAIRSGHFQEKVEALLGVALESGIYPVFGDSADTLVPMVATRDVGAVVAEMLVARPSASEVVDFLGPAYTERQVAGRLGLLLGRPLQVVPIPAPGWVDALIEAGSSRSIAESLAELYDAEQRGILRPQGDRLMQGRTEIDVTLRDVVQAVS
jgi:uncharacterized protein YbjT (DUF2867 family)